MSDNLKTAIREWLSEVDDAMVDDPSGHDATVRIGARWWEHDKRIRDELRQALDTRLMNYFDLPEGAVPNGCVGVCKYFNTEGEMQFHYSYDTTTMPISTTIGLMELVKLDLYRRHLEETDES